jgi:CRISPR-associated endoribonuclease cas2
VYQNFHSLIYNQIGGIMVIVSYDISNDKLRTKFAKYLSRFGHRLQYSVFEIDNSERIVDNIVNDLKNKYEKSFSQEDSVIIFKLSSSCEVLRFGYAKNDEKDFIIIS